ncbi:MAG: A-macroglobulin complement component, partial [Candidatus Wallbacteria bacterium]|nr:A-macroglobulin complement component [Candidatus Wallbacteria bacterium]
HEGRGRVFLTPKAGLLYHAALDEPAGVRQHFPLPAVSEQGLVLTAGQDIVPAEGRLHLKVASTGAGPVTVVVSRYEKEIRKETVALETGAAKEVALQLGGEAAGVLRVTALDSSGTPRAERLVLRQPKKAVQVKVSAAPEKSSPGGKVTVQISTTDETGEPIAATVLLSAVDDALLETIEKRERAPRLPVQVLLGAEVRELADSHVYLAGGDEAARRTDLLLGTQGWRRLVFKDPAAFVKAHGEKARRALALKTAPVALLDELGFAGGAPRAMAPGALGGADIEKAEAVAAPEMAVPQRAVPAPPPPPALDAVGAPAEQDARAANLEPAAQPAMADADVGVAEREEIAPAQAVGAVAKMRQLRAPRFAAPALAFVREYAHRAQASAQRRDFAETLYWNAALMTDAKGQGSVAFELSDSVTTFRLRADAVSKAGGLGEGDAAIESRKPFYVEAKLPLEVTAGDRPLVPVSLVNGTEEKLEATLAAELTTGIALAGEAPAPVALGPGGRGKVYLPLEVAAYQGETRLRVRGTAGAFKDEAARKIAVVPAGFPVELNFGGRLEQEASLEIAIPPGVDPASVRTQGALHPSPLAVLTQALSALLQEPCGCFEQASSSNYPNVMIMQYLKGHRVDDAELLNRTNGLLESGYSRLAGYECKSKGYEWFGGDPGHEALSAYGLMQFVDMSQVYPVDKTMVERTRSWLLARRDGKGGFERNLRSLDSFGAAPPEITDAYILWSLCEAGEKGLDKEIARMKERASASDDPYYLGLAANILQRSGDGGAASVLDRLVRFQDKDGHVAGAKTSITRSSDENLDIETTSLASLAWLRSPAHTARVEKAMEWLLERCKGGRFGATQATVLALKAVLAYDVARSRPKRAGTAVVSLDGKIVDEVPFTPERQGAIEFPSFAKQLTPGTHKLELKMTEGSPMPYSVQVVYHASKPASSPKCQVGLTTKLAKAEVAEGETVDLTAELVNREKQGLPMTVAIVGLPGGLETRPDQLKELTKDGTIDFYETRGREVILYRRSMAPGEKRAVVLNLVAAIPGTYEGPASRAYLYYTDEHKDWAEGLKVKVTPSTVK